MVNWLMLIARKRMRTDNSEKYLLTWKRKLKKSSKTPKKLRSLRKQSSNKIKKSSVFSQISQLKSH